MTSSSRALAPAAGGGRGPPGGDPRAVAPPVEAVGDGGSACIRQAAFVFGEQTGAAQSPKQRFDSPPHYAQHTSEVLQDLLGMSKEEVHQLSDEGAVFCR